MIVAITETITWVRVEKPTFDLVGVVLGSLALAGALVLMAFVLGLVFGWVLIRRDRGGRPTPIEAVSLHLDGF